MDTSKRAFHGDDAKQLGDLIEAGQATLVVIGESRLEEQLDKALHARRKVDREGEIDADAKELAKELDALPT